MSGKELNYTTEEVYKNSKITDGVYELIIKGSFKGKPGQFYMIRCWDREPLLSRPISIHSLEEDKIVFLYQVIGEGTRDLSRLKVGEKIQLTGPLGNGFETKYIKGKVAIVAGGIGIAPMLQLAKSIKAEKVDLYAGFRNEPYCLDKFTESVSSKYVSTETGIIGVKGYITDIFKAESYDMVLCCGPEIMMNKVIDMCRENKVPVYVSMEKHMACGIGACLVCTCKTKEGNKRTCKDGPVFSGEDLMI